MKDKITYGECCCIIAKKYNLGVTLVIGHKPKYWIEAAELYAQQSLQQILEEAGEELPDENKWKEFSKSNRMEGATDESKETYEWMRSEASKVVLRLNKEMDELVKRAGAEMDKAQDQIQQLKEELARKDKQLEAFDLQGFYEWAEKEKWYFNTWKDGKWHNSANTHFQTTPTGHLYTIYQAQKTDKP